MIRSGVSINGGFRMVDGGMNEGKRDGGFIWFYFRVFRIEVINSVYLYGH